MKVKEEDEPVVWKLSKKNWNECFGPHGQDDFLRI
jgi:hypothetical protein